MQVSIKYFVNRLLLPCLLLALATGCGDITGTTSSGISGGGLLVSGVGTGGTGVVKLSAVQSTPIGSTGFASAIVFLDLNNNGLPDADEPFAYTDAQGHYTLPVAAGRLPEAPLLLQALAGATVDLATGQLVQKDSITALQGE